MNLLVLSLHFSVLPSNDLYHLDVVYPSTCQVHTQQNITENMQKLNGIALLLLLVFVKLSFVSNSTKFI